MAALDSQPIVQIANADLAVERQNLLREWLGQIFAAFARRARIKKRLIYTVNADGTPLDRVLRMNEGADAIFTGFSYDAGTPGSYKGRLSVETPEEMLAVDAGLRYPRIAELLQLVEQGQFRHRKLILVGDIREKLEQFLRSALPVTVTAYTDPARTAVSQPQRITGMDGLDPDSQAPYEPGQPVPLASISALTVAEIPFDGILHMPEQGNQSGLGEASLVDTARRLYLGEGLAARMVREQVAEEKRAFIRGKKVFILLEPDLDHVIAERFQFEKMERLYRHHTLEEALAALQGGRGQGIVDYFEREGYGLVFEVLSPEERDKVLLAVVGERLPELLLKEIDTVRPYLSHLEQPDLEHLFYSLPEGVVDEVLAALQEANYEQFLAVVPPKIREAVILDFLGKAQHILKAWRSLGDEGRKEILTQQAAWLHGMIFLLDTPLSKQRFPALEFEFERNYHSDMLAKMGSEQQQATYLTIVRSLQDAGVPKGLLARHFKPEEIEQFVVEYVARNAPEFYNRLNPALRKQVWLTVGREYREAIIHGLHALDKIEILQGSKDAAVSRVFSNETFLAYLRGGTDPELMGSLLLMLKKLNKGESKTALLKHLLSHSDWRPQRTRSIPALLNDPGSGLIYEKLADRVEELDFRFDSLVCTREHQEVLCAQEPLRDAVVTVVDELVDPGLYGLFQQGRLSQEDYDAFSRSVEKELDTLHRKLAAREGEDPVGVYVVETMEILHRLGNQTLAGGLDAQTLERLDERVAVRRHLVDSVREHVRRIDDFLAKGERQLPMLGSKLKQALALGEKQEPALRQAHQQARSLLEELRRLQRVQAHAGEDRKKVALTQKELSVQFFQIIQPLILEKVRSLGSPLKSLMRMVGLGGRSSHTGADQRVIFKFSDEEIEHILRYRIVFCAHDPVLAQFVATCLRIDGLEDSLFTLATADALPQKADIDLLFYGPGYSVEDFADSVKKHRLVPFADEAFYKQLKANEALKARTKHILTQTERQMGELRTRLEKATQTLKTLQAKRRQLLETEATLEAEQHKLSENMRIQRDRQLKAVGELELLETRLAEVDGQFDALRERLAPLLGAGAEATGEVIQAGHEELAMRLRAELVDMNRELARLMFIKGVKDAGETISRTTQAGILQQIETREVYPFARRPFKKLLLADDGSNASRNLKQAFLNAALPYFKLRDMGVQEVSIKRLLAMAEQHAGDGKAYPFVALFSDRPADGYSELKLSVKRIRSLLPETYQLLFTPFGDLGALDPASPDYRNLLSLKDQCTLVNATLGNVTEPGGMLRVLREKAPLR